MRSQSQSALKSRSPDDYTPTLSPVDGHLAEKEWRCEVSIAWEACALVKSPLDESPYYARLLEDRLELQPCQQGQSHGMAHRFMRKMGAVAVPPTKVFMLDGGPLKVSVRGGDAARAEQMPSGDIMVVADHEAVARICFPFESERESWAKEVSKRCYRLQRIR